MPNKEPSPPRLSQELTREQHRKLQEHIPWGIRRQVFDKMITDFIEVLDEAEEPEVVLVSIIKGVVSFKLEINNDHRRFKDEYQRDD